MKNKYIQQFFSASDNEKNAHSQIDLSFQTHEPWRGKGAQPVFTDSTRNIFLLDIK